MDFFKDEASKYIFALTKTDGKTRMMLLKITSTLYYDKDYADIWYKNIYDKIINYPDKKLSSEAIEKLNILYMSMISDNT